jgi:dihydroorotate dehydrogenase
MSKIYENLLRPLLFNAAPETAHEFGIETLKAVLGTKTAQKIAAGKFAVQKFGTLERFGLKFKNPLGIAAGFDKNGAVVNQLAALGFGFVEVGTVTFEPQKGNEKPRLFRLPDDRALINRLGFNNEGAGKIVERLKEIDPACVLGVNIGKNKTVPNERAIENYLASFDLAFPVADYIAVNVSSPNTPNLRELQKAGNLEELLAAIQKRNQELAGANRMKPLLVKIAPDLSEADVEAIVAVAQNLNLAGVIATNTTVSRENLKTKTEETGGLSGAPVRKKSTEVIRRIYRISRGKLPIIGVGGIFSPEDAFEKIAAGACLIQAYTGFVYKGFTFARDINSGLAEILREKGFRNVDEAVGTESLIN